MALQRTVRISRQWQEHSQGSDMAYDNRDNRFRRKEAVGMQQLVQDFIKEMKIASGVNRQRAMEAWKSVSGASAYTLDVSLDKCILYVTLNSSLVRNQLYFQKDVLLRKMNEFLETDTLFVKGSGPAVKNIVLR